MIFKLFTRFFLCIFLAHLCLACASTGSLKQMSWLLGTWKTKEGKTTFYESWQILHKHEWAGKGFAMAKNDTVFTEKLALRRQGKYVYYVPTVKDQNNGQPVLFQLAYQKDSLIIFENPKHDFPQKITYRSPKKDSLCILLEGIEKGKPRKLVFFMNKLKK